MKRIIYIGIFVTLVFHGCGNDLDVLAPHKEMPLVYCVLDQLDTMHVVRIQKAFVGEGNAWTMAQEHDSIYYQDAEVVLERWSEREFSDQVVLTKYDGINKDEGNFANVPHTLFTTDIELNPWSEYRLKVNIPEIDMELNASTFLVGKITLNKPNVNQPALSFSDTDKSIEIEWRSATNARVYFLQFRLNYLEVNRRDTAIKEAYWTIAHFTSENSEGGELMETMIQKKQFYRWLPSKIALPENGVKRIISKKALDIVYTIGGEELYTYLEVHNSEQNPMIQKPVYTNIANGIGIFSARTTQEFKGKALSFTSIDSVAHGQYTFQLGFVDSTDDYYRR